MTKQPQNVLDLTRQLKSNDETTLRNGPPDMKDQIVGKDAGNQVSWENKGYATINLRKDKRDRMTKGNSDISDLLKTNSGNSMQSRDYINRLNS